jgi:hypothetical protein
MVSNDVSATAFKGGNVQAHEHISEEFFTSLALQSEPRKEHTVKREFLRRPQASITFDLYQFSTLLFNSCLYHARIVMNLVTM